ncbi:putative non-structural protein [Etheostoma fonticola aquareovirus]|uniref:putative non-structural protein n=1 Tax=Etheostoma fonticola aquareovirus TaxID=1862978 RepID=UPI0008635106|nr:putative non-structural protein [Etheostoma fonticola aquareovirus]ANN11949.2 putative non-structural protein [Etheostoma fonticola aquareovirus]
MAARVNLKMLGTDSSLTKNKQPTSLSYNQEQSAPAPSPSFQSLPNLSFKSPPTWSLTYKGVEFHGVCDPPCEPFIPISGYLSHMISNMSPSTEPTRMEDVNNLVAVGLAQLGVTPSMSLGEVEVLLNDRLARVQSGDGLFFDPPVIAPPPPPQMTSPLPVVNPAPAPAAPAPAPVLSPPQLAAPPVLDTASTIAQPMTPVSTKPAPSVPAVASPPLSDFPALMTTSATPIADRGPTLNNEPSLLWSESTFDEIDGALTCPITTDFPPLIDNRLYSQVVRPPAHATDSFLPCEPPSRPRSSESRPAFTTNEPVPLMELSVSPPPSATRRPPRTQTVQPALKTGRRKPHHIADDNTYNEARLAYARGRPTTSPLYNQGLEIHAERAFFSSFPHHVNGKWVPPASVLNVVAGTDEDLNDSTIHSVRATDCHGMYEVTAANGEVVSRLNVMFIDGHTTAQSLTDFITPHSLIAVTPYAAALMVRFRLTKGVFSKSHRRLVMGIDPVMIHLNPRGVALWDVLTQHMLEYAELYASASLRDLVTAILDPINAVTTRWVKRSLPPCVSAVCEMRNDPIPTLSHILDVEAPPIQTSSVASSLRMSELQAENAALTSQVATLEAQLEAATLSLATTRESIQREQAIHSADSLKQYLHDHVCVNCHEESFLNATVGVDAACQILTARQGAREQATDKIRQTVSSGFAETVNMLQERTAALDQRVKTLSDELGATASQLRSTLSRLSSAEGRAHELSQRNELLESKLAETRQLALYTDDHQKATITALQDTVRANLPYVPPTMAKASSPCPPYPPVRSMMPDFDPSDLLM